MEIVIRARHIGWNEELREHVERSIDFAVDRHKGLVDRISVYLTDLNGPRGGVDKLCQVAAEIRGARPVIILEKGEDIHAVVNRAASRLGYRVGRRADRQRISRQREYRTTIRAV